MFEAWIPPAWKAAVLAMEPAEFMIFSGLTLVASLYSFLQIFSALKRHLVIENTPTSKIRSAAQGYVELDGVGYLMTGTPILAPLSGMICTWYSYTIEEKSSAHNSRDRWTIIKRGTSDELFLLKDETGECIIDPEGAEVIPSISEVWRGHTPLWNGGTRRGRTGNFRYTERRMHPGDGLYAIGQFRTVGSAQELPDTHDEVRQLLAEWKRDQLTLHARFDANNDGVIDTAEWEKVRREAWNTVLKNQAQRQHRATHHILTRPDDGRPYIVSALYEASLSKRYWRRALIALGVFLLTGSLAAWLLSSRLVAA